MIEVVAVALIDRSGRTLLQQRRTGRQHGGLWEFPGGKVEPGESAIDALIREIDEELGIELDPTELAWLARAEDPVSELVISLYTCCNWAGTPQCLDATAIDWFAHDAFDAQPMPPLDRPLAAALKTMLEID